MTDMRKSKFSKEQTADLAEVALKSIDSLSRQIDIAV
jgi:hypothetical protein